MSFKEASKVKLRIPTTRGNLSVEQLWDLSLTELDALAVKLEEEYDKSKGKSFLNKKTTKDKTIKLQFDIVLEVLSSKYEESETLREAAETRAHNAKIRGLIAEKQDEKLKNRSIAELERMIKE